MKKPESEEYVIGSLMENSSLYPKVQQILIPEMFTTEPNQPRKEVYTAILTIIGNEGIADAQTLILFLEKNGQMDPESKSYILGMAVNGGVNIIVHALIVAEMYLRRGGKEKCIKLSELFSDFSIDVHESLDSVNFEFDEMRSFLDREKVKPLSELSQELITDIEARARGEVVIVPTGMKRLDYDFGGFENGTLNILAARPGMGKTALSLQLALNMALAGYPVGIFSMEMSKISLMRRMMGNMAGIDTMHLREATRLEPEQWDKINATNAKWQSLPMFIDDTRGQQLGELIFKSKDMVRRNGVRFIIFDYLQLIRYQGQNSNRNLDIGAICKQLRAAAHVLNVPFLVLAQLNRDIKSRGDKRPKLTDLRDSGEIEQDSDVIQFIHSEAYYGNDTDEMGLSTLEDYEIIHAKAREGLRNSITKIRFIKKYQRFYDPYGEKEPVHENAPF